MHSPDPQLIVAALRSAMPPVLRWAGAMAKRLRGFDIALSGKSSGNANTDALTLADLTLQELLVAALRDADPVLRTCRIEAEETTGDLDAFAAESPLTIALDPIDGTRQFRDRTGDGYCVMLHLRDRETVHYSLVYLPEAGPAGTWVEVTGSDVRCGPDVPRTPARQVLDGQRSDVGGQRSEGGVQTAEAREPRAEGKSPKAEAGGGALAGSGRRPPTSDLRTQGIYVIGFLERCDDVARAVTEAGLTGYAPEAMPGSIYPLLCTGEFAGSLIHTPNVYDFPVSLHIARALGGDAVWVHNREPVHFGETWIDERADMLRLPGIVACSPDRSVLETLCRLAQDWNPLRYPE